MTAVCEKPAGPPAGTKIAGVVAHAKSGLNAAQIADVMKLDEHRVQGHLSLARKNGWIPNEAGRRAKTGPMKYERVAELTRAGKTRKEVAKALDITPDNVDRMRQLARARGFLPAADPEKQAYGAKAQEKRVPLASTPLEREAAASVALDGETQSETPAQTIARLEKELADAREQTRRECGDLMRLYGTDLETARAERDEARVALANAEARLESTTRERDRLLADLKAGAGELLVPCPEPGTDMARLVGANRLLRRERDEAREELASARVAGQICPSCERALDEYEGRCSPAPSRVTVRKGGVEIEIAGVEDAARLVRLLEARA